MNSQQLTELTQKIRSVHELSVHRAEGKYHNLLEVYNRILTNSVNELTRLGGSHVGHTANTVEAEHFRVINEIIYNRNLCKWLNRNKFEESMSILEQAVKDFIQEYEECLEGQPICPECFTDIENCTCQDEVAMGKDGKLNTGAAAGSDVVNNPNHYQLFPETEAIVVIAKSLTDEEFRGYCLGNSLKYRLRAGKKGSAEEDLAKADKYVELYNKYK